MEEERYLSVEDKIRSKFIRILKEEMINYESDIFIISGSVESLKKEKADF